MSASEIEVGSTHSVKMKGFRDAEADAGVFLVAATTSEFEVFDVDVDPPVQIGPTEQMAFIAGSDGDYIGDLADDFDGGALTVGRKIEIRPLLVEGAVVRRDPQVFTMVANN